MVFSGHAYQSDELYINIPVSLLTLVVIPSFHSHINSLKFSATLKTKRLNVK